MRLYDIGEDALLDRIVKRNSIPQSATGLLVGVGDDCAVLAEDGEGRLTLVTTDMLTEHVDFRLDLITPFQLGWKSVAANISDIAAMGGEPSFTLASLGFRPDTEVAFVDDFYRGMLECVDCFDGVIAGGDMNSLPGDYVISITQMGKVEARHLALRSGAKAGDHIIATGYLGDSRCGLELLLAKGLSESNRISESLVQAHLVPRPRVPEARAAVTTGKVHAMMDISDGLGADLPKLCKASHLGAVVYADKLPVSAELEKASLLLGKDPIDLSSSGGEDFELLITTRPEDSAAVIEAIESQTGTMASRIGEICCEPGIHLILPDNSRTNLSPGWQHFA